MNDDEGLFGGEIRALKRALPGVMVFVTVLVLLRGFEGTAGAIRLQVSTFAKSFLGGGDELIHVLLHTLPLAAAAGIAAFAISSRWLKFDSGWSIVALAGIVLAGAALGGLLRGLVPNQARPEVHAELLVGQPVNTSANGPTDKVEPSGLRELGASQLSTHQSALIGVLKKPKLSDIDWLAEPNLDKAPSGHIPPLDLFPKVGGVPGVVLMAANQLLGYLVAYQPRLFLAAIVAGSWIGWSWQRRLTRWSQRLTECVDDSISACETRKAA